MHICLRGTGSYKVRRGGGGGSSLHPAFPFAIRLFQNRANLGSQSIFNTFYLFVRRLICNLEKSAVYFSQLVQQLRDTTPKSRELSRDVS